jgi:hypothetical protein
MASWLSAVDIPLFVSHRRLAPRRALPVASAAWALDSGGFTELNLHGCWQSTEREYVVAVGRYRAEVGRLSWAAPMDWMCEPFVVAKTGLSVREHQHRTVGNFLKLRELAPDLSFIPVLQGWTESDYHNCLALYDNAGVDLVAEPLVGIGSICRRQHHSEIGRIVGGLAQLGLRLHGFGVKQLGLQHYAWALASADSMAWSYDARRGQALRGCTHRSCSNCLPYALRWRARTLERLTGQWQQPVLPLVPAAGYLSPTAKTDP